MMRRGRARALEREGRRGLYMSERYDGSGPLGLKGDEIPAPARFLAIAEAMVALKVEGAPYLTAAECVGEIRARAGSDFDPEMVECVAEAFAEAGSGESGERVEPPMPRMPKPRLRPIARRAMGVLAGVQRGG